MPTYGYARVSTLDQDLAIQRAALKAAGCGLVRAENVSRTRCDGLTGFRCYSASCSVAISWWLPASTGSRFMKDRHDDVHKLKERGVTLCTIEQPVDTGTAAGNAFLAMLGDSDEPEPTASVFLHLHDQHRFKQCEASPCSRCWRVRYGMSR